MANWLSRLPKPLYYSLLTILLPIVGLVDGIGYLAGILRMYPSKTFDDDLMRVIHNTRRIEIGHGLMNISWSMQMTLFWLTVLYVFTPLPVFVPFVVFGVITLSFTIFVFWWSAKHGVDPERARRDFGNND